MGNVMAGSLGGHFPSADRDGLQVISVLINNSCNLSCNHCYLQAPKYTTYLTHREWMKFFRSVFEDLDLSVLSFAGKEVFFDDESVSILIDAIKLRNRIQTGKVRKTRLGVITNGTLLQHYKGRLSEVSPDYWDVSVDGLPDSHDQVRGKGAFAKLSPNLGWLSESYPGSVWLTHTIHKDNFQQLPAFIKFFQNNYNIHNFSIGFYKPMHYTEQSLSLNAADQAKFFQNLLPDLAALQLSSPVLIRMEFDTLQPGLLEHLSDCGFVDSEKSIFSVTHQLNHSIDLRLDVVRVPTGLWRAVRVTPEGFWLRAEDLMQVKNYREVAVAGLHDFDFNAKSLYKTGLSKMETFPQELI